MIRFHSIILIWNRKFSFQFRVFSSLGFSVFNNNSTTKNFIKKVLRIRIPLSDPSEYSKKKISSDNQNQFNRKLISSQALTKILSSISSSFTFSFTSSFSKSIIRRLKHYQDHPFTLNFFLRERINKNPDKRTFDNPRIFKNKSIIIIANNRKLIFYRTIFQQLLDTLYIISKITNQNSILLYLFDDLIIQRLIKIIPRSSHLL